MSTHTVVIVSSDMRGVGSLYKQVSTWTLGDAVSYDDLGLGRQFLSSMLRFQHLWFLEHVYHLAGCNQAGFTFARSAGPPRDQNVGTHIYIDRGHVEFDRWGKRERDRSLQLEGVHRTLTPRRALDVVREVGAWIWIRTVYTSISAHISAVPRSHLAQQDP